MAVYFRDPRLGRTLVEGRRHELFAGDAIVCAENDEVWIRDADCLIGRLGPGRHDLVGDGVPPWIWGLLGKKPLQLFFVATDSVPFASALVAYGYDKNLHIVADLPFELEVALRITSFERTHYAALGMLDTNNFQFVVDNETGLVAKNGIEDVVWGLTGDELASFGKSPRVQEVRAKLDAWWDRYALAATRFELRIGADATLTHALSIRGDGEPAEIGFGKRVLLIEEDGSRRTGVISDVEGKRVNVNWDDGRTSWVGSARLKKPPQPAATRYAAQAPVAPPPAPRVLAFAEDGCWRPATVLQSVNGWLDVQWDHGPRAWLAPSHVRQ